MATNAAESYMRGWSFAASGQTGEQADQASTDPDRARGHAAGTAALACVSGRSKEYREGWKDAAHGPVHPGRIGAYTLGAADGEAARQAAVVAAQKL